MVEGSTGMDYFLANCWRYLAIAAFLRILSHGGGHCGAENNVMCGGGGGAGYCRANNKCN